MDYRQKVIVASSRKCRHEEDDDDDLEALRLAALKSLKAKATGPSVIAASIIQPSTIPQTHPSFLPYSSQKLSGISRREHYYSNRSLRSNGNIYYSSRNNQNLIEIIPLQENADSLKNNVHQHVPNLLPTDMKEFADGSKFHRYVNNASGSEGEDLEETKNSANLKLQNETDADTKDNIITNEKCKNDIKDNSPCIIRMKDIPEEDEEDEEEDEEDEDVLLMADHEEEDSLERLMDEMEREMTEHKPVPEKKEKKISRKDNNKESNKSHETVKLRTNKFCERVNKKMANTLTGSYQNDRGSVSPHIMNRALSKHVSMSPKFKSRKKSPRRSPLSRRSPRQTKRSQRDLRLRSPRKSSPKYSPCPRSPKLSRSRSPRMSPRKSPVRSPIHRLSPQKLSPKRRSQTRSPLLRRRSRSPSTTVLLRSPKIIRLRSPSRMSPQSRSIFLRSPEISPRRLSPRRLSPRPISPILSRMRSPKSSPPKRVSPRDLSPLYLSPHKSPWSSPRNSPRISPKQRRSPPLELLKKNLARSATPEDIIEVVNRKKECTPTRHNIASPELSRVKIKLASSNKETMEMPNNPVLEARRRKFESTRLIDPIHDNKKIKLCRKESMNATKSCEIVEEIESLTENTRETSDNQYELLDAELCLDDNYDFDELEEHVCVESTRIRAAPICDEGSPVKFEKERSKKKKKKDKELYQIGKLKTGELPLSERIGKEKKCKKRKELISENVKDVDAVLNELMDEETDLRTELSRRRAERLNRTVPIHSARLLQSAFKGVVNEVVKSNAKVIQRHLAKTEEKSNSTEIRRVTVLHRALPDIDDSEDDTTDAKVPIRFRLGMNKPAKETLESKCSKKSSKRQGRKVKHKNG